MTLQRCVFFYHCVYGACMAWEALSYTFLQHMQIIRESGWQGLFQGLKASLLGTAVSQVPLHQVYSLWQYMACSHCLLDPISVTQQLMLCHQMRVRSNRFEFTALAGGVFLLLFPAAEVLCSKAAETPEYQEPGTVRSLYQM